MDFSAMLKASLMGGDDAPTKSREELLAEMNKAVDYYANPKPCRFKVGDIVTPTKDGPKKGHGFPNYVFKVYETPFIAWGGRGDPGELCNVEVVRAWDNGDPCLFRGNDKDYELWGADGEKER